MTYSLAKFRWLLTIFLPLLWLYRTIVAIRNFCYDHGIFKSTKLPRLPFNGQLKEVGVISIGNLSMGGTGKTPLTIFLATALRDQGWKAAIVARGYRREKSGLVVVSDGKQILAGIAEAGDEPLLMAQACEGIPVVIDRKKLNAARAAVERFVPDVILVDDGFQHRQLYRDIDIVMLDTMTPLSNAWSSPGIMLREPGSALRRAEFIIINESGKTDETSSQQLIEHCRRYTGAAFFLGKLQAANWRGLPPNNPGETLPLDFVKDQPVLLVCGIARPERFRRLVEAHGARVRGELAFGDHYRYDEKDFRLIATAFKTCGARYVLTTAKDAVKLAKLITAETALPIFTLETTFEVEPVFFPALLAALRCKKFAPS
ncbi:tetraacyldisaccharide 4'-kinase [candidate division KSB1 bacterium]|nr:tetraacyldisaccharide 4'-kinase [candidate division KSB1 bacterium]